MALARVTRIRDKMALAGVRVIEMAGLAPAPLAGMILSDFGATVVRVDRPGQPPIDTLTRGKKSLCVSMKEPTGNSIIKRLCSKADILIEPYRPGVMEKLELGPQSLLQINPRLIYARLTGFGQSGPLSGRAGHDINYLAISGILSMLGRSESNPHPPINLIADFASGSLQCVIGILMALFERHNSGKGQVVDVAMTGGSAYLSSFLLSSKKIGLFQNERGANMLDGGAHFYDTYKTLDDKYMAVGSIESKFYKKLLKGLEIDEPMMSSQMDEEKWPVFKKMIAERFVTKTREEWTKIFAELDACVEPVLNIDEAAAHPHNKQRGVYTDTTQLPNPEPLLSRTPAKVTTNSSQLVIGEHTVQILKEIGYTETAISELLKSEVVYQSDSTSKL